jgi:hypothetical protein
MAREGVDYSYSRPDVNCLRRSGKTFVVRYMHPTSSKTLDPAEARRLANADLDIVTSYEGQTAGWMLDGYERGRAAARDALRIARNCGMPDGRPIYYSLDIDPQPLSGAQWDAAKRCLAGAASVHGRSTVGVYGGFKAIEVLCPTWARWGWQTYAWSGGAWSHKAHIQQYRNEVDFCGGQVDFNRSNVADFGQWPGTGVIDMPLDATDKAWLRSEIDAQLRSFAGRRWDDGALTLTELLGKYGTESSTLPWLRAEIERQLRAFAGRRWDEGALTLTELLGKYDTGAVKLLANDRDQSATLARIEAAVQSGTPVTLTPEQVQTLVDAVVAAVIANVTPGFSGTVDLSPKPPAL